MTDTADIIAEQLRTASPELLKRVLNRNPSAQRLLAEMIAERLKG